MKRGPELDAAELLRAIARRDPDAVAMAERFARELAEDEDAVVAARASLLLRAFEAGDVHAIDRAIDLPERLLIEPTSRLSAQGSGATMPRSPSSRSA